ncbi:hypothetical protein MJ579_14120 [Klebsiella pneumoniae]|nr:hypothetical protein MJ579_14120 [Klebsiella pneumoniae]
MSRQSGRSCVNHCASTANATGVRELPLAVQLTAADEGRLSRGSSSRPAGENGMRWQAVKVGNGLVLPVFTGEDGKSGMWLYGIANLQHKTLGKSEIVVR